ncbi:THO complex subunit 2-like protein [Cladobotryum mycophilum]|uniref:THO complex subunit 2 n=1 Tax=Cladobotryum mycophilum TaxID=491253 RepID=A0ABR0SHN6_9HYPO
MPAKRKRPDRPNGDGGRPSPHRPGDSSLVHHERDDNGNRGRGRGGHRGGPNRRESLHPHNNRGHPNHQQNQSPVSRRVSSSSQAAQLQSPAPAKTPNSPAMAKPPPPPSPAITKPSPSPVRTKPPSSPAMTKLPSPALTRPSPESAMGPGSPTASNYRYDNLTDEKIRTWAERGREEIVRHGVQSRDDVDITELSSLFQEFIHAVVESRLNPVDAGACVKEILGDETSDVIKDSYAFAPHTLLLDSLAIVMDNDTELYRPGLREFLIATSVSPALMRQVLDAPLLQQLGLIRDTFARLGVRQATNLLYRQANYNLLREETEGYSKLVTELFTTSSVISPSPELAEQTFERVKALIGTFDLDVGRVLDVTLDVAAAVLIKQFKFFVKFLRISSWWPRSHIKLNSSIYTGGLPTWAEPSYPQWNTSEEDEKKNVENKMLRDAAFWERAREIHLGAFFELGGRRVNSHQPKLLNGNSNEDSNDVEKQWMEGTKTLPPPGNKVAAQLLGFKLLFYNTDLRDKTDVLPANLLYLAALLIKVGFLSLTDLYPHLSPPDEEMERVREEQTKKAEQEERASRGGPMNALLMAGVLPQGDDDNPASSNMPRREPPKKLETEAKSATSENTEEGKVLPEPLEQKVRLLVQLLTIGAIPESLFILGRFPWITDLFPEVLSRIHRILHITVDKVFNDSRPRPLETAECPTKEMYAVDQSGMAKGSVRLGRLPVKKVWRWPYPDKWDTNENQNYRFYWDEWADNIPVCQTVDDIFTLCNTLLNISGVNIGKDESLLSKLASIGAKSLADDTSETNYARWLDLLRRLLVPALSHTKANASVVNAIWDLLKRYPLSTRYSIYAEWFEGQISRLPAMRTAFARATAETRGTMKRVSLTNLSEMAKQLAKTSYSSPGIVFRVAFEQLESYPNLIEAFVECAKYFTDLSYDVLVWSLMSSLGKSRSRTQADHALTTSKWLQALSKFSGKVFKRYPGLNPTPVLQYVNDQLSRGNSTDLIILKEFITSMGGIVDAVDFTDYQVLSMAGGERLRRHTLIRGQDRRFDNVKSSKRLIQALADSKLAVRFLLNLAQYRMSAIFQVPEDEAHIKYLSSIVDDSHQTLVQYLDFLWSNLDPTSFDAMVPSIAELINSFGLDVSLAFLIGRVSLSHRLYPWGAKETDSNKEETQQPQQEAADKEGDVSMSDSKATNDEAKDKPAQEDQVGARLPVASKPSTNAMFTQKSDDPSLTLTPLQPLVEAVRATVLPEVWQKMTPELYVIFWALQLGDLFCPEDMYKNEKDRLESEGQAILKDRSDMSRRGQERKNEKRQELLKLQLSLSMELKEHRQRKGKWKECLIEQFQSLFPDSKIKTDSISDALLEQCFLPRVLLSPADTEFTYKFIMALHEWRAPNFKLMSLYDRFFNANRLRSLIFTSSVREAEYLGRFLKLILRDLSRWHKNDPVPGDRSRANKDQPRLGAYDKEAKGPSDRPFLGFALTVKENGEPETLMEHAQFKDLLFRWHKNLNTALKSCLAGTEWMHIRNAITVLKAVLDFFPAVDFMATQFSSQLQRITKQEAASKIASENEEGHRVDLSVAAQGAMSELQKRKPKWVMVQAFRPNAAGGPQSDVDKTTNFNLRANASDFKPQSSKSPANRQSTADKEDGEVQDGKEGKSQQPPSGPAQSGPAIYKDSLPAKPSGPGRDLPRDDIVSGPPRSSTPMASQGPGPFGPRGDQRPHMLPDRPAHNLPTRPDVPIPGHFTPERYAQPRGHDRRDIRDSREGHMQRDSRDPRDAWDIRDGKDHREPREPREPRPLESDRADRGREYADRRGPDIANRDAGPVDLPPRPRQDRDRSSREPWGNRAPDRPNEQQQGPAPPTAPADLLEPTMNPQRAALFAQDDTDRTTRPPEADRATRPRRQAANEVMDSVNPERAALIDDRDDGTHGRPRDDGRERGPRTQSPRRGGRYGHEHGPPTGGGYDERHGRPYPQENRNASRNARERSPNAANYRGDKAIDRDGDRAHLDKMRETQSAFHRPPSHGQEPEHRPSYQDQNYGRLNPVPVTSDIPSGPRGRGRGASRANQTQSPAVSGRTDGRFAAPETPRAPSPERHPPSGPSSSRGRRAGYEHGHGHGPPTPSSTPGAAHQDRGRNFSSAPDKPLPAPAGTPSTAGVHPDRLAQIGGSLPDLPPPPPPPPPPGPPPHGPSRSAIPSTNHNDRTGPRHSTSEAIEVIVPTGPSGSGDRVRGGGGRRQLAGINNMLQQAQASMPDGSRSQPSRSNPPRQMLGHSDIQVLAGGSPTPSSGQERPDSTWHEPSVPAATATGGEGSARGENDRNRHREGRSDRSKRTSRRSSRERDRDVDVSPGTEEMEREVEVERIEEAAEVDAEHRGTERRAQTNHAESIGMIGVENDGVRM